MGNGNTVAGKQLLGRVMGHYQKAAVISATPLSLVKL